jgi:hypothetical protein
MTLILMGRVTPIIFQHLEHAKADWCRILTRFAPRPVLGSTPSIPQRQERGFYPPKARAGILSRPAARDFATLNKSGDSVYDNAQ